MGELTNSALIGQLVVLLLLLGLVWIVFKEVMKIAVRILLPAGILVGVAVWLGWLNETMVGAALVTIGDGVLTGVRAVAGWITSAALSD